MKKTVLIEKNPQLVDFFGLNLLAWVGSHSRAFSEAIFAIEYLQKNAGDIDLIITRGKIKTEKTAQAIYQYLQEHQLKIPLIVLGDNDLAQECQFSHIDSAFDIKELIQSAARLLGVTAKDMAALDVPDYFEIPIEQFKILDAPICDVYKKKDINDYQLYLKAFDSIAPNELDKIAKEELPFLYVQKKDRLRFVSNINEEIASKVSLKELNEDEQMGAVEMSQNLLQQKIARLGITEETVQLSQRNMKFMAKTAKGIPSIKHLLKRLIKNKSGFQFRHSQVLMFVASHLLEQLDWVTEEQRDKLQFMAFWHDIALENSQQAQIHSEEELKKSNLSPEEKDLVRKHAQIGATILSKYPNAPIGVEQIIKQHHGVANGLGFSTHYSQNISPMAIVFILSEDLVTDMIEAEKKGGFDFKKKILQMRERYSTQRFKKIIDALESLLS